MSVNLAQFYQEPHKTTEEEIAELEADIRELDEMLEDPQRSNSSLERDRVMAANRLKHLRQRQSM